MNDPRPNSFPAPGTGAVIVAAGAGTRMKGTGEKLFLDLGGMPLLGLTLSRFAAAASVEAVVLVVSPRILKRVERDIVPRSGGGKVVALVEGGARRQDSVFNGLKAFPRPPASVLIHDGDRPFVPVALIEACALHGGPVIAALPARDTIKQVEGEVIAATLDRKTIWQAQTPQAFPYRDLLAAYERSRKEGWEVTDDASIMERAGFRVRVIEGPPENIKLTAPGDAEIARAIYARLQA